MPGSAPYVRGASAAGSVAGGWDIRQRETVQDPALANAAILEALEGGATSIQLRLQARPDAKMLDRVLADVLLDLAPVGLDAKAEFLAAAKALLQVATRRGVDAASFHADLNADPLGAMVGGEVLDPAIGLADAAGLAGEVAAEWPGVVALLADGRPYHAGGASEGEELACAVATGIGYLRALVDAGLPAATAAGQIGFALATDTDFFLSLAKFRALRRLWGQVLDVAGASAAMPSLRVHAETAERMLTRSDPHVNILRGTVAAFAAAAGGAGSITVLPFDHALGMPTPLARRIARNTQLVLLEEAQLGRVLDPAGGSWFAERLTEELATKAWSLVQEVERRGGMLPACARAGPQSGSRRAVSASRPISPTGASRSPGLRVRRPARAVRNRSCHRSRPSAGRPIVPPIPSFRLSAGFERLRARSDAILARTGDRPRIFLCTLGRQDEFAARAAFARNLFEAGGIATVAGDALPSIENLGHAFRASGTRQAAICSSDANYVASAEAAARTLKHAHATRVYLMGRPDETQRAAWQAAGVDEFVHAGADVLATLERTMVAEAGEAT